MLTVGLPPAFQSLASDLVNAGFRLEDGAPGARVLSADDVGPEEVRETVAFALEGGGLVICGGDGPLLSALHLLRLPGRAGGEAVPLAGGEPIELREACPVTGVGYALFRVGPDCVALGGDRGAGRVVFVGSESPPAALVVACLRWISRQSGPGPRSIRGEAAHS